MENPVALVTGGARGIGEAISDLLRKSWSVLIADRDFETASETAKALGVQAIELDIAEEDAVVAAVSDVESRFGPIQGLVNCAGPLQNTDRPEDLEMRMWDRMTDVHLRGTWLMTRAVGTRMARRGSGSIVTIASVAGMQAWPVHAYGPAKAALINLMQGLAAEWGCEGVRVNCISPGFVRTPGTQRGLSEKLMDAEVISDHTALKRLLEPKEIATAAAFLLSDESGGITGINLPVDAGFLAAAHWGAFGARPKAR